jgi:hypothetical protein
MDWFALLYQLVDVCIIPLLGLLTAYIVKYINIKSKEITDATDNKTLNKYIGMLADTITTCVIATNQTYVEALKKDNAFSLEAQKEALKLTYEAVLNVLTDEDKEYLTEFYGDLNAVIIAKIEAEVNSNKK